MMNPIEVIVFFCAITEKSFGNDTKKERSKEHEQCHKSKI